MRAQLGILVLLLMNFFYNIANAQIGHLDRLLSPPMQYTILKTEREIRIDGKDNEKEWNKAPWTNIFTDIASGGESFELKATRCKMLWDNHFLYVYVELKEPHIWASFEQKDDPVYQDNAFEMFIDTDGDTHNYMEFQINAYGTVWDLFMPKPYRNGGNSLSSWDIKGLKKAIHLNGTTNDPTDKDESWNIELAIPFESIIMSSSQHPAKNSIWRMQFARVDWDTEIVDRRYVRKRDSRTGKLLPEKYVVWSPVGIVNLHYPERWGYILFSDKRSSNSFLSDEIEAHKILVWKYYYLQQDFKRKVGNYASSIQQLNDVYPDMVDLKEEESKIEIDGSENHFWIKSVLPSKKFYIILNERGEFRVDEV